MAGRKKSVRKALWITEDEKRFSDFIKKGLIIGDSQIYMRGVHDAKRECDAHRSQFKNIREDAILERVKRGGILDPGIAEQMGIIKTDRVSNAVKPRAQTVDLSRFKFGKGKQNSVKDDANLLKVWFGNAGVPGALSEYAQKFAKISTPAWLKMAESEKNLLILALLKEKPELVEIFSGKVE